jgi:predicted ATP-grasp superfamily ATP-dependent carboligase
MAQLRMKPVVVLDCDDFPSTCRIIEGGPRFPLQICASLNSKISLLASDFIIPATHEKQLARGLIGWSRKLSMGLIISLSLSSQKEYAGKFEKIGGDIRAAYSTESAKQRIIQSRTDVISNGIMDGLSAALLTEGSWNNFDVIALQVGLDSASPKEIAERTIQAIDIILPEVKFDSNFVQITEQLEPDLSEGSTGLEE